MHFNRRTFLQSAIPLLLPGAVKDETEVMVGKGRLEVSATSFDCTPPLGLPAPTYGENPVIREIQGPLETRLFAFRQGDLCVGWSDSDYEIVDGARKRLAAALGTPIGRTIHSSTHNHSTLEHSKVFNNPAPGSYGEKFFARFEQAAAVLAKSFTPASVSWATGEERTIVYNRKGHRPDGTTYFIREEDRVKLPGDFTGHIDPVASLVRLDSPGGNPRLLVTHFTGHPVISYNLEYPVINPDYCGWALRDLLDSFGPQRPTAAFLQGCAGDISAKGMFAGPKLARESGRKLGQVLIDASRRTRPAGAPVLAFARGIARVPYGPLPPLEVLERQRRELLDFQRRVDAHDPDTLHVLGYNFSETMKMGYRRNLATPFLRWTDWAVQMQKMGKSRPEEYYPLQVQVVALGDVAIVSMQAELFVDIGLSIRRRSPFALTIPAAYSNGVYPNYIGTSRDVGDREYMSAFYRYIQKPPYAKPAGDVIADKAVELLEKIKQAA